MPPHGNLTNMGLTEPETERKKLRIIQSNRERKSKRLPGEEVTFWAHRHKRVHDP